MTNTIADLTVIESLEFKINKLETERDKIDKILEPLKLTLLYYKETALGNTPGNQINNNISRASRLQLLIPLKEEVKRVVFEDLTHFESSKTIAERIIKYFPEKKPTKFHLQVSGLLSLLKREGNQIDKYQFGPSKKDTVWAKKEWFAVNGKPKEEYFEHPIKNLFENKKEQLSLATP